MATTVGRVFSFFSILAIGLRRDTHAHAVVMWSWLRSWRAAWITNLPLNLQPMDVSVGCWWQWWLVMWYHPIMKCFHFHLQVDWDFCLKGTHTHTNTHTQIHEHTHSAWGYHKYGRGKHILWRSGRVGTEWAELTLMYLDKLSESLYTNTMHTHTHTQTHTYALKRSADANTIWLIS